MRLFKRPESDTAVSEIRLEEILILIIRILQTKYAFDSVSS